MLSMLRAPLLLPGAMRRCYRPSAVVSTKDDLCATQAAAREAKRSTSFKTCFQVSGPRAARTHTTLAANTLLPRSRQV